MRSVHRLRRLTLLAAASGFLLVNGCLAALERNLDTILSPEAGGNLLTAPYGSVSALVQAFVRFVRG